ncbi:carboxy-terminal domain cyclin [Cystoisospora suis]|uniref:Carboxy-terminal domain cyclin n=1 Tax=Cystoisospora suis TaxID=483139 RepID=A0A2C6L4T5_9APIC|nr:carboxy-terminal domain cyclin [Cystoisospora suis]
MASSLGGTSTSRSPIGEVTNIRNKPSVRDRGLQAAAPGNPRLSSCHLSSLVSTVPLKSSSLSQTPRSSSFFFSQQDTPHECSSPSSLPTPSTGDGREASLVSRSRHLQPGVWRQKVSTVVGTRLSTSTTKVNPTIPSPAREALLGVSSDSPRGTERSQGRHKETLVQRSLRDQAPQTPETVPPLGDGISKQGDSKILSVERRQGDEAENDEGVYKENSLQGGERGASLVVPSSSSQSSISSLSTSLLSRRRGEKKGKRRTPPTAGCCHSQAGASVVDKKKGLFRPEPFLLPSGGGGRLTTSGKKAFHKTSILRPHRSVPQNSSAAAVSQKSDVSYYQGEQEEDGGKEAPCCHASSYSVHPVSLPVSCPSHSSSCSSRSSEERGGNDLPLRDTRGPSPSGLFPLSSSAIPGFLDSSKEFPCRGRAQGGGGEDREGGEALVRPTPLLSEDFVKNTRGGGESLSLGALRRKGRSPVTSRQAPYSCHAQSLSTRQRKLVASTKANRPVSLPQESGSTDSRSTGLSRLHNDGGPSSILQAHLKLGGNPTNDYIRCTYTTKLRELRPASSQPAPPPSTSVAQTSSESPNTNKCGLYTARSDESLHATQPIPVDRPASSAGCSKTAENGKVCTGCMYTFTTTSSTTEKSHQDVVVSSGEPVQNSPSSTRPQTASRADGMCVSPHSKSAAQGGLHHTSLGDFSSSSHHKDVPSLPLQHLLIDSPNEVTAYAFSSSAAFPPPGLSSLSAFKKPGYLLQEKAKAALREISQGRKTLRNDMSTKSLHILGSHHGLSGGGSAGGGRDARGATIGNLRVLRESRNIECRDTSSKTGTGGGLSQSCASTYQEKMTVVATTAAVGTSQDGRGSVRTLPGDNFPRLARGGNDGGGNAAVSAASSALSQQRSCETERGSSEDVQKTLRSYYSSRGGNAKTNPPTVPSHIHHHPRFYTQLTSSRNGVLLSPSSFAPERKDSKGLSTYCSSTSAPSPVSPPSCLQAQHTSSSYQTSKGTSPYVSGGLFATVPPLSSELKSSCMYPQLSSLSSDATPQEIARRQQKALSFYLRCVAHRSKLLKTRPTEAISPPGRKFTVGLRKLQQATHAKTFSSSSLLSSFISSTNTPGTSLHLSHQSLKSHSTSELKRKKTSSPIRPSASHYHRSSVASTACSSSFSSSSTNINSSVSGGGATSPPHTNTHSQKPSDHEAQVSSSVAFSSSSSSSCSSSCVTTTAPSSSSSFFFSSSSSSSSSPRSKSTNQNPASSPTCGSGVCTPPPRGFPRPASPSFMRHPTHHYSSSSSTHHIPTPADLTFLSERLKDANISSCIPSLHAGLEECRAAVIDSMMAWAVELQQTCLSPAPDDLSRSGLQLAISLLDRSGLISLFDNAHEDQARDVGGSSRPTSQENENQNSTQPRVVRDEESSLFSSSSDMMKDEGEEQKEREKKACRNFPHSFSSSSSPFYPLPQVSRSDPEAIKTVAALCLSTAMQFESPNALALEGKIRAAMDLKTRCWRIFNISYAEAQKKLLNLVHCVVCVPISIDFANYFLYKLDRTYETQQGNESPVQLIAFLLDCFSLTPLAVRTPAALAAAAAVQLAKRICDQKQSRGGGNAGETGFNSNNGVGGGEKRGGKVKKNPLWIPELKTFAGLEPEPFKAVLKTINEFLTKKVAFYPGLRKLHAEGWAAVQWEHPASQRC